MRILGILVLVGGLARAACVAIPSGKILARDLFDAVPLFQALDPGVILGLAPFPGAERVLSAHDILLTARRYGLAPSPGQPVGGVCVVRSMRHFSIEEVKAALLSALDMGDVRLDVLEFSNPLLPPGRLQFQRAALSRPPGNNSQLPVIWRGRLIYDDQHSLAVWAKARISVDREIVVAAETIPKGTVIRDEQVATRHIQQFPLPDPHPGLLPPTVGRVARQTISAGQPIMPEALDDFKDVLRGATVHVQAIEGGASIRFDAVAQASGQKGETIIVHNPSSGRNFRALIEGREQVSVRGAL